jgi:hypothetical protein
VKITQCCKWLKKAMQGLAEWLPSKHESLSSNPSAAKKKKKNERKKKRYKGFSKGLKYFHDKMVDRYEN